MDRPGKIRHGPLGVLRPEGDGVGEVPGVGAAADGIGPGVFPGDGVVGLDADLHGGIVQAHVEGRGIPVQGDLRQVSGQATDRLRDLGAAGIGGITAVQGLEDLSVLRADDAADDGQGLKEAVVRLDAQAPAPPVAVQLLQKLQHAPLVLVAHTVCQQIVHQHADGVHRALGQGGVAAQPLAADPPEARLLLLHGDALRVFQVLRLHQGFRLVGDGVGHDAAADLPDPVQRLPEEDPAVVDALLPVAEGEVGVGAEAEERRGVIGKIVCHIAHAGLLIGAQQGADRIFQRDVPLLQVLEGIEAEDAGALVVQNAAANDPALPLPHGEGVMGPALAGGDHIQVGDSGEIPVLRSLAQLGIADLVGAVHALESQLPGDLQALLQGGLGAGSEGRALLGLPFHAVDGHESRDIPENGRFVFLGKEIQIPPQFFVHSPLLLHFIL